MVICDQCKKDLGCLPRYRISEFIPKITGYGIISTIERERNYCWECFTTVDMEEQMRNANIKKQKEKLYCPNCGNDDEYALINHHEEGYYKKGKIPTKDDEFIVTYIVYYCSDCQKYFITQK